MPDDSIAHRDTDAKQAQSSRIPRPSVMLIATLEHPGRQATTRHRVRDLAPGGMRIDNAEAMQAGTTVLASPAFAQANSPWENAVGVLQQAFTSTIARGLSLVAIVVSGLTFAFGEGGSKRVLAGVLFGVGMAIAAVNFLAWLFPG